MGKKYLLTIAIPGYRRSIENVEFSSPVQHNASPDKNSRPQTERIGPLSEGVWPQMIYQSSPAVVILGRPPPTFLTAVFGVWNAFQARETTLLLIPNSAATLVTVRPSSSFPIILPRVKLSSSRFSQSSLDPNFVSLRKYCNDRKGSNRLASGPDYRVDALKLINQAPRVSVESLQTCRAWRYPEETQHLFCWPIQAVSGQSLASNCPVAYSRDLNLVFGHEEAQLIINDSFTVPPNTQ
ncbi:structural maintenance of chromosomes protein 2-2 [Trichonephila clavipes]|nr:structural maintenance of chromosomes protein 2-2 [Trichonephila clavipes]